MNATVLDLKFFGMRYYREIIKLIRNKTTKREQFINTGIDPLRYCFSYKEKGSKLLNFEEYSMSNRIIREGRTVPDSEITDLDAIQWYLKTLENYNATLKQGEKPRKFSRAYKVDSVIKFTKIS